MEATRAANLLEHRDEIMARPKRTWISTAAQKKELQEKAKQAKEMGETNSKHKKELEKREKKRQKQLAAEDAAFNSSTGGKRKRDPTPEELEKMQDLKKVKLQARAAKSMARRKSSGLEAVVPEPLKKARAKDRREKALEKRKKEKKLIKVAAEKQSKIESASVSYQTGTKTKGKSFKSKAKYKRR